MLSITENIISFIKYGGVLSVPLSIFNTWYNISYQNKRFVKFDIEYKKARLKYSERFDDINIYITNTGSKSLNIRSIEITDLYDGKTRFNKRMDGKDYNLCSEVKSGFVVVCEIVCKELNSNESVVINNYIEDVGYQTIEKVLNGSKIDLVRFSFKVVINTTTGERFEDHLELSRRFDDVIYNGETLTEHLRKEQKRKL